MYDNILLSLMLFSANVLLGLYLLISLSCNESERSTLNFSLYEMTPFLGTWHQWSKVPLENKEGNSRTRQGAITGEM